VRAHGFNYHNTLMIDSDRDKVVDYPLNSIVIRPYQLADLKRGDDESLSHEQRDDLTLLQVYERIQ
jgi:hypothetical protein